MPQQEGIGGIGLVVAPPQPARLLRDAEEPLQPQRLHQHRRAATLPP